MLITGEAARRRQVERATLAWSIAKLGRVEKLPRLDELLPRPPRSPEEAAAEMQAAMQTYREIAAERGKIRSWSEWLH